MKKKMYAILLLVVLMCSLIACGKKEDMPESSTSTQEATEQGASEGNGDGAQEEAANEGEELLSGQHKVEMDIEGYGTIALTLDADIAPITVTNFMKLVNEGFYNGLTFHRIINGFMIQGGDPEGTGMGGASETIKGEFAANGIPNDLAHTRGVISMARSQKPDSASSQFFIMHQDAPHLDGSYAAFGIVTSGMEVVDAICETTPVEDRNGTVAPKNQPVITEIRVVE